jgi:hypothetical protein
MAWLGAVELPGFVGFWAAWTTPERTAGSRHKDWASWMVLTLKATTTITASRSSTRFVHRL